MPRKRRPRYTGRSSVHRPDPPEQTASPSPTPDRTSQPTREFTPPLPPQSEPQHSTQPGPSTSANPWCRRLPLNWNEDDFFILTHYMYQNSADFDNTVEWWGRMVPHLPGKTVQELRLFSFLYMRAYGNLLPHSGRIPVADTNKITQFRIDTAEDMEWEVSSVIENPRLCSPHLPSIQMPLPSPKAPILQPSSIQTPLPSKQKSLSSPPPPSPVDQVLQPPSMQTLLPPKQKPLPSPEALVLMKYFDWTLEESRALLNLIERNPSILRSRGGWMLLARHFPGKKASDIGRHIAMVKLAAVFMGALNSIPVQERLRYSAGQDAAVNSGDQHPSTLAQPDDSQQTADGQSTHPDDSPQTVDGQLAQANEFTQTVPDSPQIVDGQLAQADDSLQTFTDFQSNPREPRGMSFMDSVPSTSGRPPPRPWLLSSKPSSTRSGRGGRRGKLRISRK